MKIENNKDRGRIGLSMAINYFSCQGYTVSVPLNDTQWYDLIIEKEGKFEIVQCKCTATDTGTIDFRSTGGTKGSTYDNILNHSELDWLFCVDKKLNMFCIPMKDIIASGNTKQIKLKTEKMNQGFQTYQYRVQFSD
jgi:hypothetical protein